MQGNRWANTITILTVDDDPACLRVLCRMLGGEFVVVTAASAKEALELMDLQRYDVLITDYVMPGNGGLWLLDVVSERHPTVKRVLISGSPPSDLEAHLESGLAHASLPKPATKEEIVRCVRSFFPNRAQSRTGKAKDLDHFTPIYIKLKGAKYLQ